MSCETEQEVAEPKKTQKEQKVETGEFTEKYPDGTIKIKGTLVTGIRQNVWESFYPSGVKQSEDTYDMGVKTGKTASYYPNG